MATSSGGGQHSAGAGYYPDPSIPGYIRYWNGAAWVPGTSRPAPADGEELPGPPPGAAMTPAAPEPAAVPPPAPAPEETGPVFLDEDPATDLVTDDSAAPAVRPRGEMDLRPAAMDWDDPQRLHGSRPEPASAWQADASRQSGFGGERDRRVSWGADSSEDSGTAGPSSPALPGPSVRPALGAGGAAASADGEREAASASGESAGSRLPDGTMAIRAVPPGGTPGGTSGAGGVPAARDSASGDTPPAAGRPADGTMAIRSLGRDSGFAQDARAAGTGAPVPPADGTMAMRSVRPATAPDAAVPAQSTPAAHGQQQAQPQAPVQPQDPAQPQQPQTPAAPTPPQAANAGRPSWAQQVQELAQPGTPAAGGAQGAGAPEGVIPWRPPVNDPFLQAVQDQAAARPAPLGRRLAARLIDSALFGAVVAAVAVPFGTQAADHINDKIEKAKLTGETVTVWLLDGTTAGCLGIVLATLLLGGILYEALPTARWGRTLGKRLCKVRVMGIESHDNPSYREAIVRWLLYGALGVLGVGIVNVLWGLFDRPWRQCWHDKAARTFVAGDR